MNSLIQVGMIALVLIAGARDSRAEQSPRLQFINSSNETIDIYWLRSDSERIFRAAVEPRRSTVMSTTLNHRFAVVGRLDQRTEIVSSKLPVQAFCFEADAADHTPKFYAQRIDVHGFPIVASANVNPFALKEAAYLIDLLLAKRPDIRDAMINSGSRLCLLAWNEYTTDLPEFAHLADERAAECPQLTGKDYWDARARGLGGSDTDPFCSCGEENLLGYPGDPYAAECILIHEFAHHIHLRGMSNIDPTFDSRLRATYDAAMKAGLWRGKYASVNHHEYFAEGVQSWFDNNRVNDHDHNHVHLRSQLIEYDPGLATICREVFGDTELKYTKPHTRLVGHLEGYDPSTAPTFRWPDRLAAANAEIKRQAQGRDKAANAASERELRRVAGWSVLVDRSLLQSDGDAIDRALDILERQLVEIDRVAPEPAVRELKKIRLYFSSEYSGTPPTAEFHPDADWLRSHGRDPAMAKGVEFTNVRVFEQDANRMPNFVLHELAHAYHNCVLPLGFDNPEIKAAFEAAKESGKYDRVERSFGDGRANTFERAYAMSNPMEYFAECSEAYLGRNDFFPFTRDELSRHDPVMFALLTRLWRCDERVEQ